MSRHSLVLALLVPLFAACDVAGESFDDAHAIAATKVEVCHFHNGSGEYTVVDVAERSVDSHLSHGDTLFAGDQDCDGCTDGPENDIRNQCLDDAGVATWEEFEALHGELGQDPYCACHPGWCSDCGTFGTNDAPCLATPDCVD